MRRACFPLLIFALLFCTRPAAAEDGKAPSKPDSIVGEWHILTEFGGEGRASRITIRRSEEGHLAGTYYDSGGSNAPLEDLSFEGGTLKFKRSMRSRTIGFEAHIEGDTLTGKHLLDGRKIPASGRRGKKAFEALLAARRKANERSDDLEADYLKHRRRAAPRDAFPVLTNPKLAAVEEAEGIRDDEPVIGVVIGKQAKAYPISIMGVHELVNDTCGGQPIAASW